MLDKNTDYTQVNRAELIRFLSDAVKFCHGKATVGRLQAAESDSTRLSYMRALAQMSTPLLAALRDTDLEAINKRLDEIEARQGGKE
ncbi:hypothetical protein [Methanocorpusculum bavaricum]|uniref:hypothetical protein n=1 Tax=Methanocorpusculum bavaricum TaxID=71518 RepID=UPI0005B2C405|nr:hypothetical protein [Methanocorpusculum bavaricum]